MPLSESVVLAWLAACCLATLAGTWLARRYAISRALLDHPGERRSHATATPRGGGIAIVLVLLLASIYLAMQFISMAPMLATFAIGLAMVAAIGWLDDHRPLSPWLRLGMHVLASALFAIGVWQVTGAAWLAASGFVATVVLTNVWNFMDGIDGLAVTQAAIASLSLACLMTGAWSWLALVVCASALGFLPFNFPRASIFLGDVGSGALGYTMGAMLTAAMTVNATHWPLAMLPMSAFLVDAGLTLLRRLLRGERWWTPHVQHAYQVWSRRLQRHVPVTLGFALWTLAGAMLAVLLREHDVGFTCLILWLLAWYALAVVFWCLLQHNDNRET